ncbi:alpha/beta hydrolase [Microbulbifer agarilyticus]|uniref:alpha/beta hydrolase n=1 Tax=Microbulbifer agarilyticus TaxID=260552 RepID=UPI001CD435C6|nr:alpha/beta hydrolase [Microbulbifer agarilyticus]MCA0900532.1 alpha/beta hydrolase [Microbulbifer agarilyticus]
MTELKVHPELAQTVRFIPTLPFHRTWFVKVVQSLQRIWPSAKGAEGITIDTCALSNASIRVYQPTGVHCGAALLWMHGGGLVSGRAAQDDTLCSAYARELGLIVVSVDYRLAPAQPFPAALNDCHEAWQWLVASADRFGIDPARIALSGQSAGGGLAASLAQRLTDEGDGTPACVALFCPMLDDRTSTNMALDPLNHKIWNNRSNRACWSAYLQQSPGGAQVAPYAVPARREDLSGLPKTWIGIGDIDLFYQECLAYAQRLCQFDVECSLYVVSGAPHAFETIAPRAQVTRKLFAANFRFLQQSLGLPTVERE